jgi:hypothetical protein
MEAEPITVEVRYDKTEMEVKFPEDSKYLYTYRENNILDKHVAKLVEELSKRKITVVSSNADYIVHLDKIICRETVATEELNGESYKLSKINNVMFYTIFDQDKNTAHQLRIAKTNKDYISSNEDEVSIIGFDGTSGSFEETAKKSTKRLKKLLDEIN